MNPRSPSQLTALAKARKKRKIARARKAPVGWQSPQQLLESARRIVAGCRGLNAELARYLKVHESSVRRWIKRQKMPLQPRLNQIARWHRKINP